MELKLHNVFVQKKPLKAQHAKIAFSFELGGIHIDNAMWKKASIFQEGRRFAQDLWGFAFEMRTDKGWGTSGKQPLMSTQPCWQL